ncbi:glycoside hydrolase family 15 protein [Xylariales sp. PMI_506]|nr:glycoside hydrolase family 15 protein [Xylariales sp. PMI_506]
MAAADKCTSQSSSIRDSSGYLPIENYGLIGNMRTTALVSVDGSVDFMCWPEFDSPSVFCRLLDTNKGGYYAIAPTSLAECTIKQQYLPSSAILQTRYIHNDGVVDLVDFFPRPKNTSILATGYKVNAYRETTLVQEELKKWLVRRVECIRGELEIDVEIFPAFGYAKEPHTTTILQNQANGSKSKVASFHSSHTKLQLDVAIDSSLDGSQVSPKVVFTKVKKAAMIGEGIIARVILTEGQAVSFILRDDVDNHVTVNITNAIVDSHQNDTQLFWFNWLSKCKYRGGWREVVVRSLLILKLLTFEPTGAIVAAPTFSIPEEIGGPRNWDYRFSWVRDSSFTIYILLRLGFTEEADAYMAFISERFQKSLAEDGGLPIMFTIRGETEIPEIELDHLEGYKGSSPVRIGNGAAFHQQFDIYGELMDAIYLYNKYGKPISWDTWVAVRKMLDYTLTLLHSPDMSIWEVRNHKQHFVYSKVMMWVAFDRGLRLAEKRCLPCPNRAKWLEARDSIYEEVMEKGYNKELGCFIQSYENNTMIDSSILIAPLVFFIAPNDPRFISTMERILQPPEQGGLTSTGLVYRYDTAISDDGVGGSEGAFSMCTFWLVEALTRASIADNRYLIRAINLFENMLSFSNHLSMFSEEIARSGEQMGNTPQAFSHLALVSAAFNLDRAMERKRR